MLIVVVLPAPFGSEEPEHLAGGDLEVDALDRLNLAVVLDEAADLDGRGWPASVPVRHITNKLRGSDIRRPAGTVSGWSASGSSVSSASGSSVSSARIP